MKPRSIARIGTTNTTHIWFFIGRFVACILLFFVLSLLPAWDALLGYYLQISAYFSGGLLFLLGEHYQILGSTIWSNKYNINIASGCSALDIVMFYSGFLIAFPASAVSMRHRLYGLALGLPLIVAVNLLRIACLFWIGVHCPNLFDMAHVSIWPSLLIFFTLMLCAGWLQWISTKRNVSLP